MTYRTIQVHPISGALGAEISGVDLSQELDDGVFGEIRQAMPPQRLSQLKQAARLNLTNAFARDAVGPCHLFQRPRLSVPQAEAKLDDLAFARR